MHRYRYREQELYCENVPVATLAEEYGTPLWVYSRKTLEDNYKAISEAFSAVDCTICFSVKSCSSLGVLGVFREMNSGFDIVSGGELHRVIKAGGDTSRVVYAGVGKTDDEIRYAISHNIMMFNVESEDELANISRIAEEMDAIAPVSLRLNPDVDPKTHRKTTTGKKENKFGIDLAIAAQIVNNIRDYPGVRLIGADVHLGSPINSPAPYAEALEKIVPFILEHRSEAAPFTHMNCGGGFGLFYKDEAVPTFKEYADTIVPYIQKLGCKLVLEPGRSMAGNSAILLADVQYTKTNGEKTFVIIDAGMNDLIRPAMYESYHFLWPIITDNTPNWNGVGETPADESKLIPTDVVGPICESSDVFTHDRPLPPMQRGDTVAIFSAGAYGSTMSSNYNSHPRAAEVLVSGEEWAIIRQRETWDDLIRLETGI